MRAFHPSQQCVRCRRCFAQYDAALSAAIVLGKVMDAVDGMHVYFAEGIKQCTKQVLHPHVEPSGPPPELYP